MTASHTPAPAAKGRGRPGIYLMSPSGRVTAPERIEQARAHLKELGFRTALDRTALAEYQRFAGTDTQRIAAFRRALRHKGEIVMATRGGYGMTRLLPHLDWRALADSGKRFVGHSDFTAFQLALLAQTGAVSWAGPMASFDFGGKRLNQLTVDLFMDAMRDELELLSFETDDADPVDARGVLWGGNLALVCALVGTPWLPRVRGILFLEDVNESAYRVERMLIHLLHSGILATQKAIVLGRFTEMPKSSLDANYDMHSVIAWLRHQVRTPIITGLPFGHVSLKATLPVGARVGIATEPGMAHLVFHEH